MSTGKTGNAVNPPPVQVTKVVTTPVGWHPKHLAGHCALEHGTRLETTAKASSKVVIFILDV